MEDFKKWLANHSISAKSVATCWLLLTGMYYTQPAFHDYVMNLYSHLPTGIHAFVSGVVIPALIFWRTQKKTTITTEVSPGETGASVGVATSVKPADRSDGK